jgi:hypothetical protein
MHEALLQPCLGEADLQRRAQVSKASTQKGENILANTAGSAAKKKKKNTVTLGDILQYVHPRPARAVVCARARACVRHAALARRPMVRAG